MIVAFVTKNANKTGRTNVIRRTAYFVNKCSQIGTMSANIWLKWLNFDC
jgi:hypothetical protein